MVALESGVDRALLRLGLAAEFVLNGTALATWSVIFLAINVRKSDSRPRCGRSKRISGAFPLCP